MNRTDYITADIVERGIAIADAAGVKAAAAFLAGKLVPITVALRVLAHPSMRRPA